MAICVECSQNFRNAYPKNNMHKYCVTLDNGLVWCFQCLGKLNDWNQSELNYLYTQNLISQRSYLKFMQNIEFWDEFYKYFPLLVCTNENSVLEVNYYV